MMNDGEAESTIALVFEEGVSGRWIDGVAEADGIFSRVNATLYSTVSVRWSVGRSVGWSPFHFFGAFELYERTAPAQMLK